MSTPRDLSKQPTTLLGVTLIQRADLAESYLKAANVAVLECLVPLHVVWS